jgi:hypothetical protein
MKLIFLDVHGVLVHSETVGRGKATGEAFGTSFYHAATVDHACVQRVMRIVRATGARIVLSSTWRRFAGQSNGLRHAFVQAGVDRREVRALFWGATPHLGENRAEEVTEWIGSNPDVDVERYLVIDDGVVGNHPQLSNRPNHFTGGLQDHHVEEAIRLLGQLTPESGDTAEK